MMGQRLYIPNNIVCLSLNINFVFANIAYTDEMQRSVAFCLGLHPSINRVNITFLIVTTK